MATNDSELVAEAKSFTGYDNEFTDAEVQTLVDIGKEEIRSHLGVPDFTFFVDSEGTNTYHADRALFWFTCIAIKAKAGEIASVSLTVDSLESRSGGEGRFSLYFDSFAQRIHSATRSDHRGPTVTSVNRADGRTYSFDRPNGGN